MRPSRRVTAALAGTLLLVGCGADGGTASGSVAEPSASPATPEDVAPSPTTPPAPEGDAAAASLLDVTGRSLDGGEFAFADAAGTHLVLWMWAPW